VLGSPSSGRAPLAFPATARRSFRTKHVRPVLSVALLVAAGGCGPGRCGQSDARAVARDSRTVDVHVSRVRQKLGPRYGQCLVTEYRVGYQFRPLPS